MRCLLGTAYRTPHVTQALNHVEAHLTEIRELHCPRCARWFPSSTLLAAHVADQHDGGGVEASWRCHVGLATTAYKPECVCGQEFACWDTLLRHAKETLHFVHSVRPKRGECLRCVNSNMVSVSLGLLAVSRSK